MISLYAHSGSGNHGCEALVRATAKILNPLKCDCFSLNPLEDKKYSVNDIASIKESVVKHGTLTWFFWSVLCKLKISNPAKKIYYYFLKDSPDVALSIGGDNYCYDGFPESLAYMNSKLNKVGCKTVLWGCSVEPEILQNPEIVEDMNRYALITARESITYHALINAGVGNTRLFPDPAFQLDCVKLPLLDGFIEGNTVGINLSPMIIDNETADGVTYKNYENLIQYILDTTDMAVALIPHVVWEANDDRVPLRALYHAFQDTHRVVMIEDHNCMKLKGYISRCRFFVGARTHSTIAAYSTCVPTLVVGYSVKAKGIAKDIFGTYDHYVLPVQSLKDPDELMHAFDWLMQNEVTIRTHLQQFMPSYCAKAMEAGNEVKQLVPGAVG